MTNLKIGEKPTRTRDGAGRFKKGENFNRKGIKNKKTREWEAFGKQILEQGLAKFEEYMYESDPDTYMKVYIQILEYFKPKLSRTEVQQKDHTITIVHVKQKNEGQDNDT